ncbi:phosphotransferase enzyme family protein [Sediminispirochaeta bajacaliforniensis]|uniref:phosphotransferase enzyme family protein n=1 Tax=Sediminispirochaeta bajacaliforniensis TaxID=148 RepID=UPI00037037AE|nr:aminoglycoside phosphotransferase family protein [Sediminispirochaeta bajacaliforniensis]
MNREALANVCANFRILGDFVEAHSYGNGHINDTYAVSVDQAGRPLRYILQRINSHVFHEPIKLMENVHRICVESQKRLQEVGRPDASRRSLTTVLSRDGKAYSCDDEGEIWRLYLFIEGAVGYDIVENRDQAYQAAKAFGAFQQLLTELPGKRLHETIKDFHNTPSRFRRFEELLQEDPLKRKDSAAGEIDFYRSFADQVSRLTDLNASGRIPERVTHNDTKLNNVLIDTQTNEAVCVIDLDTAMPGLAPYDFGDLVRTSTSPAAEDERDLSKVCLIPELFKAITQGYLETTYGFLLPEERSNLFFGAKLMTYEVGLRFLTDYLEGDRYFKISSPDHNLVRCRTQMKLVQSMQEQSHLLEEIVESCYEGIQAS